MQKVENIIFSPEIGIPVRVTSAVFSDVLEDLEHFEAKEQVDLKNLKFTVETFLFVDVCLSQFVKYGFPFETHPPTHHIGSRLLILSHYN